MFVILFFLCAFNCRLAEGCEVGQIEDNGLLGTGFFKKCKNCPSGTYQADNGCVKCEPGSYNSAEKQGTCQLCAPGWYSAEAGSRDCRKCSAGQFSKQGAVACTPCPEGSFSLLAGGSCIECSAGFYADKVGSTMCTACPLSKTSPSGSVSPLNCSGSCSAGYIHTVKSNHGNTSNHGNNSNHGNTEHENVVCQICAAGQYSKQGSTECSNCTAGKSSIPGSGSCTNCSAGYFSISGGECEECGKGSVTADPGSGTCTQCPSNTFSSADRSQCKQCGEGHWSEAGAHECEKCPAGFYLRSGTRCEKCPEQRTSDEGSYNPEHCYLTEENSSLIEQVSRLNYKQIIGLVCAGLGLLVILMFLLYLGYWRHRRQEYSRSLKHSGSKPITEEDDCVTETCKITEQVPDYSSCVLDNKAGSKETSLSEHIYDVPSSTGLQGQSPIEVTKNPFLRSELSRDTPN